MLLDKIFGNKNAERVLLYLYHYGELHPSAIAKGYGISLTPLKNQLERFEEAGILLSKAVGRSRVYEFNKKNPLYKPFLELIKTAYESIPLLERQKIFWMRQRPRRKGKPVL